VQNAHLEAAKTRLRQSPSKRPGGPLYEQALELQPKLSRLQAGRIKPSTQVLYLEAVRSLLTYLLLRTVPSWDPETWGDIMVDFVESRYEKGQHFSVASRALAALMWIQPSLRLQGKARLPAARSALEGWRKAHPGTSRPPIPRVIAMAVAVQLLDNGEPWMALLIMVLFESYMRVSEGLALQGFQVLPPVSLEADSAAQHVTVLVHAEELQETSKTREFDHSIAFDLERQHEIAQVLAALAQIRGDHQPLWHFDYGALRRAFGNALNQIGASSLGGTLHGLRHGGASHDFATKNRDLMEIQSRGAWKSPTSLRRYEKHGRISRQLLSLPQAIRQEAELKSKTLQQGFAASFAKPLKISYRASRDRALLRVSSFLKSHASSRT
jgi:integrase